MALKLNCTGRSMFILSYRNAQVRLKILESSQSRIFYFLVRGKGLRCNEFFV